MAKVMTTRITVRLDDEMVAVIDKMIEAGAYENRSEVGRALMETSICALGNQGNGEAALNAALYDAQKFLKGPVREAFAMTVKMLLEWPEDDTTSRWINLGKRLE